MLSDVNLALGEVGMESDQYQQAIADLQSCLRLREFLLEPTDRRIAEV
jgi:nuclear autoantigenic sperm protein